jgi:hypothetical protein
MRETNIGAAEGKDADAEVNMRETDVGAMEGRDGESGWGNKMRSEAFHAASVNYLFVRYLLVNYLFLYSIRL